MKTSSIAAFAAIPSNLLRDALESIGESPSEVEYTLREQALRFLFPAELDLERYEATLADCGGDHAVAVEKWIIESGFPTAEDLRGQIDDQLAQLQAKLKGELPIMKLTVVHAHLEGLLEEL